MTDPAESARHAVARHAPRALVLGARCTLAEAAALKARLLLAGSGGQATPGFPLIIDGSAVAQVDSAGLQLLVAFAQREVRAGRRLVWTGASPELLRASRQLGLVDALGLGTIAERQ